MGMIAGRRTFPEAKEGKWFFRELWVDGGRATRARTPNRGAYFHVKESPDAGADWSAGQTRFRFEGNDIPAGPVAAGAEVMAMCRWVESRMPIKSVDADQHLVTSWRHSHFRLEPGDPYWLEGDGRWLDEPGEWFLDRASGTIYYLPLPGQAIDLIEAIAPKLAAVLKIEGSPKDKKFVENVTVLGVTFSHTEWMQPEPDPATTKPADGGFDQGATPVPAMIEAVGMRNSTFDHCSIEHIGNYAIELGKGCAKNTIAGCTLRDLGAGGIKIGEMGISQSEADQCFANRVTDCEIADGGAVYPSGVGIWIGQSYDNVISHNHIHDLFYTGISTGWSWGYGDSLNRGNIVEKNLVHHIGKMSNGDGPILSDMGAVYLLGARNGSVVRGNVFHDIAGVKYGGWGIYLDEGSSDSLIENNLVYRTTTGGFHLHYGKDNVVRNNIFAFSREAQIIRTRVEDHNSLTFEHNIVYWTSGPLTNTTPEKVVWDYNLYGPIAAGELRTQLQSFAQWQAAGEDVHSVVADPGFADADHGDFRLKSAEEGKKIGFEPFDTADVGPRGATTRP